MKHLLISLLASHLVVATAAEWELLKPAQSPTKRHEAAFVELDGKFYLFGGRGIKAVEVYDPIANRWETKSKTPLELHHFQPLAINGLIYVIGAFTGPYPNETPVPVIHIYDPRTDTWSQGAQIPENRRRGGAGAVYHEGAIYVVCGIVDGHLGDFVPWMDKFEIRSGQWTVLPDAPRPRDHFQAALVNGHIIAAGGRVSSGRTKQVFQLTVPQVDVYHISTQKWRTLEQPIPTPRAGCFATASGDWVIIAGGESGTQRAAHFEVEALNIRTMTWRTLPRLETPRHGTGLIYWEGAFYTAAGCAQRGGSPEQDSIEKLTWQP